MMNLLSLFSGCGGMDIGFEGNFWCDKKTINKELHPDWIIEETKDKFLLDKTGFNIVFANDIRKDAKSAWINYFKKEKSIYHTESIVDLVKEERAGKNIFPKDIDMITGGFPCQDFSVSGKRMGFNSDKDHLGKTQKTGIVWEETRGNLYVWMKEVVSIVQPKMFIAENVSGLESLGNAKEMIEKDFSMTGYLVVPSQILYAPDFGIPQSRKRIFFIGFKKDILKESAMINLSRQDIPSEYSPYPEKTHSAYTLCCDILSGLPEPECSSDLSQQKYSKARYIPTRCQGQTEINLNSIAPTIRSEHHGNIEFRRLSKEHGGIHAEELNRGLEERRLTVRECARLQTFPDDYQFILPDADPPVSASSAYQLIGNAVPCILAYNIAKNIEQKWNLYFD